MGSDLPSQFSGKKGRLFNARQKSPYYEFIQKVAAAPDRLRNLPFSSSQEKDLGSLLLRFPTELVNEDLVHDVVEGLPHLFGFPWYRWARSFFESTNKINILTAGNQLGKSSSQIRKAIHWATSPYLWQVLWPESHPPRQFWYLYPNKDLATAEFETKWVPEFLPRNAFKDHPVFGWEVEMAAKKIHSLRFRSGVTIYFKTYMQQAAALQAGSAYAIFGDEEIPEHLFDELMMRLSATNGYFHSVFTATLNQEFWRLVMEGKEEHEKLPEAFKQQVSLYDCKEYEDGQKTFWTSERIKSVRSRCGSQTEVLRRIFGKFVTEEGRKYPTFEWDRHMVDPKKHPVPPDWNIFAAVDCGTGGKMTGKRSQDGHASAIVFMAVSPTFRQAIVFLGWRGDGISTTSKDIIEKYEFLEGLLPPGKKPQQKFYDWQAKDFFLIAQRAGFTFERAEKSHVIGEDVLNTLFQNNMLLIHETEELRKLGNELGNLMRSTLKTVALDDFSDALRYVCTKIPWDWSGLSLSGSSEREALEKTIESRPLTAVELEAWNLEERRNRGRQRGEDGKEESWPEIDEELKFWNDQYEG